MTKITCNYRDDEEFGSVSFDCKYDEKYYKKYDMNFFSANYCGKETCIKNLRYLNWSDTTGFVISRSYSLPYLCHKRPRSYFHNPRGFDHTTFWRKPGDKWPSFCLTEPYSSNNVDWQEELLLEPSHEYRNFNYKYKIFPKSEKSLWYPNSTNMIFWWCPDYFDFEENENLLMSHIDASELEKKCEITCRKYVKKKLIQTT